MLQLAQGTVETVDLLSGLLGMIGYEMPAWQADAACKEHPDLPWTMSRVVGKRMDAMLAVCDACLVFGECHAWALEPGQADIVGVLAGTTWRGRRKHPRQ